MKEYNEPIIYEFGPSSGFELLSLFTATTNYYYFSTSLHSAKLVNLGFGVWTN